MQILRFVIKLVSVRSLMKYVPSYFILPSELIGSHYYTFAQRVGGICYILQIEYLYFLFIQINYILIHSVTLNHSHACLRLRYVHGSQNLEFLYSLIMTT